MGTQRIARAEGTLGTGGAQIGCWYFPLHPSRCFIPLHPRFALPVSRLLGGEGTYKQDAHKGPTNRVANCRICLRSFAAEFARPNNKSSLVWKEGVERAEKRGEAKGEGPMRVAPAPSSV